MNNLIIGASPFAHTGVGGGELTLPFTFTPGPASEIGATAQYHFQQARLYIENLTVEQQLPFETVLSLSYVGSHGVHLPSNGEDDPNVPMGFEADGLPYWNPNPSAVIPKVNPNFNTVVLLGSSATSSYNSLQFVVTKRLTHGLQFQSSYTWQKLIDDQQGETPADCPETTTFPSDPFNSGQLPYPTATWYDRGVSCYNLAQYWTLNFLYSLPSPKINERVLRAITSGWNVSGIYTLHGGFPFNPSDSNNRSRSGIGAGSVSTTGLDVDRPNWNPAFTGNVITGNPNHWFNPAAFMLQPVGTLGDVGRNVLTGPGFNEFDFSIQKDTKAPFLGEAGNLAFRAEFFNIFNHTNFGMPSSITFAGNLTDLVTVAPLSNAGQITNTAGTSRQIEFSLRLSF
jgi:hypothetical protein